MATKQNWIKQQSVALNETNANSLWSLLQDLVSISNPAQPYKVPKSINVTQIVKEINKADVLIFYRDYAAIVQALIENINKGALEDVGNLIQALVDDSSTLSAPTKQYLVDTFTDIQSSYVDTATHGVAVIPPSTIQVPRYVAAGYASLAYKEVVEALNA